MCNGRPSKKKLISFLGDIFPPLRKFFLYVYHWNENAQNMTNEEKITIQKISVVDPESGSVSLGKIRIHFMEP